ncbi:MAG: hypothetical protein GEV07_17415 [Streptosporangiales bacterium]|nr:hypothetical protein [Streptosporangiales bacterium]
MKVTLSAPFGQFPLVLGYNAFTPLPKEGVEAAQAGPTSKKYKEFEKSPVGNGPYQMDGEWEHNEQINLERHKGYKGENKAHVDNVNYKIYANLDTAYQDLIAGNLDQAAVDPTKISDAKSTLGDRYFQAKTSQLTRLDFPMYEKKFQNKDLRHAFSMAINRQQIIDKIFDGAHEPATSLISPVVAGQRENPCGEYCEYDPKKAKQLYDKAGGFDGTLELWYNSDGGHEQWMTAVANQLRKNLGVKVALRKQQQAQYLTAQEEKKMTGPFRNSWLMDYPSMQNYLEPIWGTGGSANRTFYTNKQVDKYVDQGNRQPTVTKGYADYYKAEDQVLEDMPGIPLFYHNSPQAYSERIKNVRVDPFGFVVLPEIQLADA